MQSLLSLMKKKFKGAIEKAFENEMTIDDSFVDVTYCIDQSHGNYQCNSALKLAKALKKNPREIAGKIIDHLDKTLGVNNNVIIEKVEIAGPGFINITFKSNFLSDELEQVFLDPFLGADISEEKEKVIVEFSSPNVAKQLHVGHLRSTIIGDSIARLFEFLQYDVLRLNHIGDWGTQFGMLIAYLKKYEKEVLSGEKKVDLTELEKWYKQAKKEFDENEEFKKISQLEVVNLQSGEKEALHAWEIICEISRKAYGEIYDLLNVKIIERGESFYNPVLKDVVSDLEEKGLVEISDGAKCIFSEGFKNREGNPLPLMIQKSDGGYNYDTTDMAAMRHRFLEEKSDRVIVVTDSGQSLHFQMIYAAAVKAKYINPDKQRFDHVTFGLVLGADGKKFKTRSGDTEKLIDLIKGGIDRAKHVIQEKDPNISKDELEKLSNVLGVGAIKYADLSCNRNKDYHFSYDKMLKFEGNTAVFLLYSYVRVMGIKRKIAGADAIINTATVSINHPSEKSLALHLRRFGEVLEVYKNELLPNRLTDYLYELAEKFNAFFRDCKVMGDKDQSSRLKLCEMTGKVLEKGLYILGLKVTQSM